MQNNTGPVSSGYVDVTTFTRDDYDDMMHKYIIYYDGPIAYDEDVAKRCEVARDTFFIPVLKIRDLYGIDYYGDDDLWYDLYGTGYYGDSRDPSPPNRLPLYTILHGTSTDIDDDVLEDTKEQTSVITTTVSTCTSVNDNDDNNSMLVSQDMSNGGNEVHDKNEMDDEAGSISFKVTTISDTTYEEHDTDIITNDMGSENAAGSFVVGSTSNVSVLSNSAVGKNTNNNESDITSHKHTAVESIMNRTGDEDLVYLYVIQRKEDKRIRCSIAKHITGSSRNYSRAVSICRPSVVTIQKFVRRFILKNSITRQVVHHGSCSSSLNTLDSLGITTMDNGSNHSTQVITQSIHPSSRTTTDKSTANPTQGTESTTSGMSTKTTVIGAYNDVRPWGELLRHMVMVPSKTHSSNQYVDSFVDTSFPKECEYHEDVSTLYTTLTNKKVGECVFAFLIKDWQWIDIEVKKYASRALIWYIKSSVGNLSS